MPSDIDFMSIAIREAEDAFKEDEVPVGAVIVIDDEVIASDHNRREGSSDPLAHAEILVLRAASAKIKSWRLNNATLYVTKEPCIMCAGAMVNARLGRLVYGCRDIKGGAVDSLYQILYDNRLNHTVEVTSGVLEEESSLLLKRFFKNHRKRKNLLP